MNTFYDQCNAYLDRRTGTYPFRKVRYTAVAEKMRSMGLQEGDLVVDIGAGRCEFDHLLHELGLRVRYLPIDGSIDGTNLEVWCARNLRADFYVAIEILEHLREPFRLMLELMRTAKKGVLATTPNPNTVDVLGIDSTHVTPLDEDDFFFMGWDTEIRSHFGKKDDSILAWWKPAQVNP